MGLEGPWLSTLQTKGRKKKLTKAQLAEFELGWQERNKRLKSMSMPKETFNEYMEFVYGHKKKTTQKGTAVYTKAQDTVKTGLAQYVGSVQRYPQKTVLSAPRLMHNSSTSDCTVKPSPTYTGTKMIGIAQMSKSNAVPVFRQEDIIDIARMRR